MLEQPEAQRDRVRIGAVADLHCARESSGFLQPWIARATADIDILLLGGDLTDYGLTEEAEILLRELSGVRCPIVAVLGNHDYESGHADKIREILSNGGIRLLDGESCEVAGIGIAGIKGFGGGFGRGTLGPWGEDAVKQFVQAAVDESLKLESALARLRTPRKIALLHYSPIEATVEGEPREIYPFLGCGRLAEPLTRYPVSAVFHGHAHRGAPEGKLPNDAPVYNVALPLMRLIYEDQPPIRVVELDLESVQGDVATA